MKTLYPPIKKISTLAIALIVTGLVNAQTAEYSVAVNTPTSATSGKSATIGAIVKIKARSDKKVVLNWAPFKEGVSHYVLERSLDGRNYEEAAVFFTGEWSNEPEYVYTDKLRNAFNGILYYRLKVVGLDGNELYSSASITGGNRLL